MSDWTVLLPPSETKVEGGERETFTVQSLSFAELNPLRTKLVNAIQAYSPTEQVEMLGVSQRQLQWAIDNNAIGHSPTLPALSRYTGVLYDGIGVNTFTDNQWHCVSAHIVIASALWGLVRGSDRLPRYRLSASNRPFGKGHTLARYWASHIENVIANSAGPVLDLRSQSYVALGPAADSVTSVHVVDLDGGRSLNHWNKHAKGVFVRQLIVDDASGQEFDPRRSAAAVGYRWEQTTDAQATLYASR